MAERTTLHAYIWIAVFVSGVPFSLAVRWTWGGGWLSQLDPPFHDFAGGSVVHVVGGVAALAGVYCVGPRSGRYSYGLRLDFLPHDVGSVLSGVLILWVCFYGFNSGSTSGLTTAADVFAASNAAITTTMSAASAAVTAVIVSYFENVFRRQRQTVDAISIANSILSGLVAMTCGADCISPNLSIVIGIGGMVSYKLGAVFLEWAKLDDIVEAFAVHGAAGIWGTLAVGFLHPTEGLLTSGFHKFDLLVSQLIGTVSIFALTLLTVLPFVMLLGHRRMLRVKPEEEVKGLDYKFGKAARAYTTLKNNRLRSNFLTLDAYGYTVDDLIEALRSLKSVPVLPFSPAGSTINRLDQVADILSYFHVFQGQARTDALRRRDARRAKLDTKSNNIYNLAFLSHHKADTEDVALMFKETADRLVDQVSWDRNRVMLPQGMTKTSNFIKRFSVVTVNSPLEIFSPKRHQVDLNQLLVQVKVSGNHVIFLSRATLEEPYVLCELVTAFKESKNIILIRVDWPERADNSFSFPRHLLEAIEEWEEVARFERSIAEHESNEFGLQKEEEASRTGLAGMMDWLRDTLNPPTPRHERNELRESMGSFKKLKEEEAQAELDNDEAKEFIASRPSAAGSTTNAERRLSRDSPSPERTRAGSLSGMSPAQSFNASSPAQSFKQHQHESFNTHLHDSAGLKGALDREMTLAKPHYLGAAAATDDMGQAIIPEAMRRAGEPSDPSTKPVGDLNVRLHHLEGRYDAAVQSIRTSTKDGMPALEGLLAEMIGVMRLYQIEMEDMVEKGVRVGVETHDRRTADELKKELRDMSRSVMRTELVNYEAATTSDSSFRGGATPFNRQDSDSRRSHGHSQSTRRNSSVEKSPSGRRSSTSGSSPSPSHQRRASTSAISKTTASERRGSRRESSSTGLQSFLNAMKA